MQREDLINKIANPLQVGGIETAVLDNGPGRGTRVAWVNTGAGLRYKVVIDRGLDIADAGFNAHNLAWLSHTGTVVPSPAPFTGIDWLTSFGGGLVTTCGLDHAGGPETDEYGERGLHGQYSRLPATLESIIQPDPRSGRFDMSITGLIRQSQPLGVQLEMRRTISSRLGEPYIHIKDEVYNHGNISAPHMLLYHINLGWPLVDEGADICWKGNWTSREGEANARIFKAGEPFKKVKPPLQQHVGGGEEAAFVDITPDADGKCVCGIHNPKIGLAVSVEFDKAQLPWMTNWQHWGPGEYVMGLEPGTHPPVGQSKARNDGTLIMLEPGERRTYEVGIRVLDDTQKINQFLHATSD